jgi:hypothetical protein
MRRMTTFLMICSAAAALVPVASSTATPRTLRLLEIDTSFAATGGYNLRSTQPPSPGQGFTFGGNVYRWAGAKRGVRAGHIAAMCTVVRKAEALCQGVLALSGGSLQLLTSTNITSSGATDIAVVGGTGSYAGARGHIVSTPIGGANSDKSSLAIHLE